MRLLTIAAALLFLLFASAPSNAMCTALTPNIVINVKDAAPNAPISLTGRMAGCDTGPFLLKESPTGVSVKLLFVQVGVSTEIGRVIIKTNKDFELSTTVFVPGNAKTGVALIIAEVQVDKKTRATRQASLTITAPQ